MIRLLELAEHQLSKLSPENTEKFMGDAAETSKFGAHNVLSERGNYSLKEYHGKFKSVTGADARLTWITADFLAQHDIKPYRDLPMWRPEPIGFYSFSADKALHAGLVNRPV